MTGLMVSHLSAVVVLEQKLHIFVATFAIVPQVAEYDVEAGADASIQGLLDSRGLSA